MIEVYNGKSKFNLILLEKCNKKFGEKSFFLKLKKYIKIL